MGDGEKLLTHLNSALKVLLGLDIFPRVPKKKKLNFVDQCYYLLIKYYFPLHVSSLKCSSSGGYNCIHAAYGTVTLYKREHHPISLATQQISNSELLCCKGYGVVFACYRE